jgi:hypothetical protein
MWIFRKHRHLKPETLSEYLDGQLHGGAREKVARELESCPSCREELESLRATVLLLQDLPQTTVPRSFTLAGPPPAPVAAQPPMHLRAPGWAYAGAASLAGLALAVMVSADATGLLAPSSATVSPQASSVAALAQEDTAATATPDTLAAAAPTETPEPGSVQSFRAIPGPEADRGVEDSSAPPSGQPEATPVPDQETMALQAEPAPRAGPSVEREAKSPDAANATEPQGPEAATGPAEHQPSEPAPIAEPKALPQENAGQVAGTSLVWRVLEGAAAALTLAFLIGLVLRWRQSRRLAGN